MRMEDIAVTVLTAVTGRKPDRNAVLVDAGAIALSKDRSTEKAPKDYGFGLMLDHRRQALLRGAPSWPAPTRSMARCAARGRCPSTACPSARWLRVAPNHTCLTVAAHDRYHVVDGGRDVVAVWERVNGW